MGRNKSPETIALINALGLPPLNERFISYDNKKTKIAYRVYIKGLCAVRFHTLPEAIHHRDWLLKAYPNLPPSLPKPIKKFEKRPVLYSSGAVLRGDGIILTFD